MKKIAPRRAMRKIEELLTLQRRLGQSILSNPGHVVYMGALECWRAEIFKSTGEVPIKY